MSERGTPIGRFDFKRGALRGGTLALHSACLVHRGAGHFEIIALGAIAAVRVAYERDSRKLGWGVVLALVALATYAASGPLTDVAGGAASEMARRMQGDFSAAGQGILATLHSAFLFLQALAEGLPVAAGAAGLWALALMGFGAWGSTTLAVAVGSSERLYAVPGRDARLFDLAELIGDALSAARR